MMTGTDFSRIYPSSGPGAVCPADGLPETTVQRLRSGGWPPRESAGVTWTCAQLVAAAPGGVTPPGSVPHADGVRGSTPRRVDIIDETYIDAPPHLIASVLTHPRNTANAWPHVTLTLTRDRGVEGAQWDVMGALVGEFEVWVEPFWDGAIVHHYVRAETTTGGAQEVERAHVRRWKRLVTAVKDRLEPPRRAWSFDGGESARSLLDEL